MTQVTAKKAYIKNADGDYIVPYVNPADDTNPGVVTTDYINNSKAVPSGAVSTNSVILADVKNYAHSTYCGDQPSNASPLDPKKFTYPAGHRPNITDDGIASGFSNSNYLTIPASYLQGATNYSVKMRFKFTNPEGVEYFFAQDTGASTGFSIYKDANNKIYCRIGSSATVNNFYSNVNLNDEFSLNIQINNGVGTLYWSLNGVAQTPYQLNMSAYSAFNNNTIYIGTRSSQNSYTRCSIDLKQFSITVDGVPVFSGNKTGVDTIKPDDYTKINNPTISDDGVASGFAENPYIIARNFTFSATKGFKITCSFTTNTIGTTQTIWTTNKCTTLMLSSSGYLIHTLSSTGSSADIRNNATITTLPVLSANTKYWVETSWDGVTYKLGLSTDGENYQYATLASSADSILVSPDENGNKIFWGKGAASSININSNYFLGSIDLNAFKIYVDGDLVYQPCLKIPYTESKTGSKIVDSIYRDRVNDMAEQFGYANYYTLQDEPKGNYQVVGSPTISSDFVASGFSSSNYIQKALNFTYNNTCKVIFPFTTSSDLTKQRIYYFGTNGCAISFGVINAQKITIPWADVDGNPAIGTQNDYSVTANTSYLVKLEDDGTTQSMSIKKVTDTSWTTIGSRATSTKLLLSEVMTIGRGLNVSAGDPFQGSIDLKEFEVYVDNKLAYKTTIDPNFTLPQVELYGLIGQRTLRDSYRNGINYWELYSNRDLEQGGSCTSGVEVTFARPFADTNYVLSVPYSAKSATAFTPTQTGDWIAKGKGVL